MLLRLPEDISMNPKDFQVKKAEVKTETPKMETTPYQAPVQYGYAPQQAPAPAANAAAPQSQPTENAASEPKQPAPNVDTIIKYNHASQSYDKAKAKIAKKKKDEAEAMTYEGVKVFPVKHSNILEKPKTPNDKNELTEYRQYGNE